jgi:hypothetical protein
MTEIGRRILSSNSSHSYEEHKLFARIPGYAARYPRLDPAVLERLAPDPALDLDSTRASRRALWRTGTGTILLLIDVPGSGDTITPLS